MTLEAGVEIARERFVLRVEATVAEGEVLAVVGPNGAGKTTLLRALAGLESIDAGAIRLDGRVLDDPAAGVFVPAEQRGVGVAFQDHRLFPHRSALDNVAFGLRARGVPRIEALRRAMEWIERMGVGDFAERQPAELSGGQAQRVALARALAGDPSLLLLDEPLAAVDRPSRDPLRRALRRILRERSHPTVLVTHDPVEALLLAARILVLDYGAVVEEGTPAAIAARPRSAYGARLVGVNVLCGRADGSVLSVEGGGTLALATAERGDAFAIVHPHAVSIHLRRPEGSPRNVWRATVASVDVRDGRARVQLAGAPPIVAEVTAGAAAELALAPGLELWASVKATEIEVMML
jgi:molybdate transport system ATP-binding protein